MPKLPQITIRTLQECDADDVYKLFERTYFKEEPTQLEGIPPPKKEDFWMLKALPQGLSLKVLDENEKLVAALIVIDHKKMPKEPISENERQRTVNNILNKLYWNLDEVSGLLDIHAIAVDKEWRYRGLAAVIIENAQNAAFRNGYRGIASLVTNAYSMQLADTKGYKCIYRVDFDRFKDNFGNPVFNVKPPHKTMGVYIKLFENHKS